MNSASSAKAAGLAFLAFQRSATRWSILADSTAASRVGLGAVASAAHAGAVHSIAPSTTTPATERRIGHSFLWVRYLGMFPNHCVDERPGGGEHPPAAFPWGRLLLALGVALLAGPAPGAAP